MARMDSRKACLNCRQRHLKCDQELSGRPCRRCKLSSITCDRSLHTFRHVSFDKEQEPAQDGNPRNTSQVAWRGARWASKGERTHTGPRFVDETSAVIEANRDKRNGDQEDGVPADETNLDASSPSDTISKTLSFDLSPAATYFFNNPPSIIGLPLSANINHIIPPGVGHDAGHPRLNVASPAAEGPDPNLPDASGLTSPQDTSTVDSAFPHENSGSIPFTETEALEATSNLMPSISHPREAYLLKFFTQTWGPIFDCLDADQTFTKSVLHIALTSFQPLYWAILATSALQLSRVSNYPFSAAKYYRSQCSKSIMPLLLQETQPEASEETLFATYVMLRNYDHMTESLMKRNTENLFTASLAISASPSDTPSDKIDLGCAAFWVHLRQDIHIALLLQVPINTDYPPCLHREKILENLDYITSGTASTRQDIVDCAWANRMALHLVDIVNYCFQTEPRGRDKWIELRSRLDHWRLSKPGRFQPYYERVPNPSEGRCFPDIWLSSDCHVLAWLYYHTATVLLKTYSPAPEGNRSHASGGSTINNFEGREEVLIHSRAICGIVMTNPNAQALILLCHMVTVSAIFFTEGAEQNETINLIHMAHAVTGHPFNDVEERLRTAWDISQK